jgi:hypothetical protein
MKEPDNIFLFAAGFNDMRHNSDLRTKNSQSTEVYALAGILLSRKGFASRR